MRRALAALSVAGATACSSILGIDAVGYGDAGVARDAADADASLSDGDPGPDAALPPPPPPPPSIDAGSDTGIVTLADEHAATFSVASDAKFVYWWSSRYSRISKAAKAPPHDITEVVKRPSSQSVNALAVDDSGVYWLESGPDAEGGTSSQILHLDENGGTIGIFSSKSDLFQLVLDATNAATIGVHQIDVASKVVGQGGAILPTSIATDALAHNDQGYYFTYANQILTYGQSAALMATGFVTPRRLFASGRQIFFVTGAANASTISWLDQQVRGSDANAALVLATGQANPVGLAVSGGNLVWANEGDSTICRLPVKGGTVVTIADNQGGPSSIAADLDGVYWTTNTGAVRWAPP